MNKRLPRLGQVVQFVDSGNVSKDGAVVLAEGIVNGEALEHHGEYWVPVFVERDGGREATTILVRQSNLLRR